MTTESFERTLKLGKLPARENATTFKLKRYLPKKLTPAPTVFGHTGLVSYYGMLANDQYGDCVWAGAAHETMVWTAEANAPVAFSIDGVLQDYSAVTGFNRSDPTSDRGTDMEDAAKYRRKVGVIDAQLRRHQIDAYLALPGVVASGQNNAQLPQSIANAAYHFGGVGIGIQFPSTAMQQFEQGQPWSVIRGASIEGGHYVPLFGRAANGNFLVVTWGRIQEVTPTFLTKYVDEALVYISIDRMKNGKSLEGFDFATLQSDLAELGGNSPAPSPQPTPTPLPDSDFDYLNKWAAAKHVGSNAKAALAWISYKNNHNL